MPGNTTHFTAFQKCISKQYSREGTIVQLIITKQNDYSMIKNQVHPMDLQQITSISTNMNDFFGHIPTNYQATMVHKQHKYKKCVKCDNNYL